MPFIIRTPSTTAILPQNYQTDITSELISLVPDSWTNANAKQPGGVFYAVMGGIGRVLAYIRTIIDTFKAQLRLKTAFANGLDIIAQDYFGMDPALALPRALTTVGNILTLEDDFTYRNRIDAELLHPRATVQGIIQAIEQVTGAAPTIFEPFNAQSAATYGDSFYAQDNPTGPTWHTTVSNNLSTETKIYVTATTHLGAGSLVEIKGFATGGGAQQQVLTSAPGSDGGGSFITLPTALTQAPGINVHVRSKGTSVVNAGSTVSKLYVNSTDLFVANAYVAIAGAQQATGTFKPIRITSIGSDGGGPFLNLSPSLLAVPSNGTLVYALGLPFITQTTGVLSGTFVGFPGNQVRPMVTTTLTTDGCTTSLLRVQSIGGWHNADRIFVSGISPNNLIVAAINVISVDASLTILTIDSTVGYVAGDTVLIATFDANNNILTSLVTTVLQVLSLTQIRVSAQVQDFIQNGLIFNFNMLPIFGGTPLASAPPPGTPVTLVSRNAGVVASLGPSFDAFGDAGVKYTFVATITANPKGASRARILDVINRVRPAGVKAILTGVI